MKLNLPAQNIFNLSGNEITNWHDYYGAIRVLCDFSNVDRNQLHPLAYWHHGASFPIDTEFENNVTLGIGRNPLLPIWLHREDYARYFKSSKRVHVIGHAYTYVPNFAERHNDSVLIMPGHTLLPDRTIDTALFQRYVDEVSLVYPPNAKTYVCINTNCLRNGYWITEFSRAGYTIISGSRPDDENSYYRMKMLFRSFETIVSNVLGSHIAYAAYEGCRVGIWGEHSHAFALGATDTFDYDVWRRSSELEYPFLYTDPGLESCNEDWGKFILGHEHRCVVSAVQSCLEEANSYQLQVDRSAKPAKIFKKLLKSLVKR